MHRKIYILLVIGVITFLVSCSYHNYPKKIEGNKYWDGQLVFGEVYGNSYTYEFSKSTYTLSFRTNSMGNVGIQNHLIEKGSYTLKKDTICLYPEVIMVADLGEIGGRNLIVRYEDSGIAESGYLISKDSLNEDTIFDNSFNIRKIKMDRVGGNFVLYDKSKIWRLFKEWEYN